METITFERNKNPMESMGIGLISEAEEYRKKKIQAVKDQKFEEAANWRDKEKQVLDKLKNLENLK